MGTFFFIVPILVAFEAKPVECCFRWEAQNLAILAYPKGEGGWVGANEVLCVGTEPLINDGNSPVSELVKLGFCRLIANHGRKELSESCHFWIESHKKEGGGQGGK